MGVIRYAIATKRAAGISTMVVVSMTMIYPTIRGQGIPDLTPRQANIDADAPKFAIVSIRSTNATAAFPVMRPTLDGIRASYVTAEDIIWEAYGRFQYEDQGITGLPSWARSKRFNIEAKVDSATVGELSKLSADQRKVLLDRMLQALLADRFKLRMHTKTKEVTGFGLVVDKRGAKLQPGTRNPQFPTGTIRLTRGRMNAEGISIARLILVLQSQFDRPLVDKTGLTGRYDFLLQWTPDSAAAFAMPGGGSQDGVSEGNSEWPSLTTALREQLGLKIEPAKAAVETIVIDRLEKPSEN